MSPYVDYCWCYRVSRVGAFAIPGAIAASLFVREREVPTFGRVLAGALAVILVALPFALAVGAGQLVAWIMSLVG